VTFPLSVRTIARSRASRGTGDDETRGAMPQEGRVGPLWGLGGLARSCRSYRSGGGWGSNTSPTPSPCFGPTFLCEGGSHNSPAPETRECPGAVRVVRQLDGQANRAWGMSGSWGWESAMVDELAFARVVRPPTAALQTRAWQRARRCPGRRRRTEGNPRTIPFRSTVVLTAPRTPPRPPELILHPAVGMSWTRPRVGIVQRERRMTIASCPGSGGPGRGPGRDQRLSSYHAGNRPDSQGNVATFERREFRAIRGDRSAFGEKLRNARGDRPLYSVTFPTMSRAGAPNGDPPDNESRWLPRPRPSYAGGRMRGRPSTMGRRRPGHRGGCACSRHRWSCPCEPVQHPALGIERQVVGTPPGRRSRVTAVTAVRNPCDLDVS
jgi:hypothetical protein